MTHLWSRTVAKLEQTTWLPALLMRLFLGSFFFETGLAKVQNLDAMTERFLDWGIPAPAFNAALSGYTELVGGALIALGLATRIASVPLVINMLVAVIAVKAEAVSSLSDFVELDEPLYALGFFWLIFSGPGRVSLDHLWSQYAPRRARAAAHARAHVPETPGAAADRRSSPLAR